MTTMLVIHMAFTILSWTMGSVMFSKWITATHPKRQVLFMSIWAVLLLSAILNFAAFLEGVQR